MAGKEAARLTAFVRNLERTDRLILMLHYAERLNAAEVGQVLDMPVDEVHTRIDALRDRASTVIATVFGKTAQLQSA